jgi:methionyl-tRNA synthetase
VPGDDTQVMYVWFDALTNYISTLADENIETIDQLIVSEKFKKYWINVNPTQYCGKDNTRFQAAMWQAMLMAAGLSNSHQIIVNGFITGEGGVRMSKSLGNGVDPQEIVNEYGTDALRYFLLREVGSFEDSPFTIERFRDAYNSGLANGLGNLTSRIMTMAEKHILDPNYKDKKDIVTYPEYIKVFNEFELKKVMEIIWQQISALDLIIQTELPFKLIKTDIEKGKKIITDLVNQLLIISIMLEPALPETSLKIQELIKQNKKPETPLFLRKE